MKTVIPIASPVVNYLTYIQAYCGINWVIEDKRPIFRLLSDDEHSYLKSCSDDLGFGDGSLASLSEVFYFLPAYIFREDSESLSDYFTCLKQCQIVKSMTPLLDEYSHHINRLQEFNPYFLSNIETLENEDVLLKIKLLSIIYKSNYHRYMQNYWETDKAIIDGTCNYINGLFAKNDIIAKWEDVTGLNLLSNKYQLIIVPSLQFGPRANSLHYGVNIFPAITEHCPQEYFNYFISHEIGTHILKPHTFDKAQVSEENLRIFYIAFENLAKHINQKILFNRYQYELGEDYYEDSIFESLYNNLDSVSSGNIVSMYFKAIDQYNNLKS
jgi:hypothetical protein